MNRHSLSNRLLPQVWAALLASITILSFSVYLYRSQVSAQEKAGTKVLTISDNPHLDPPVGIEVYLYGKKIQSGKPFTAYDNWLEDLQIVLTNKTDDDINFVSLILDFPTEHNGEPMYKRYRINYGRDEIFKTEDTGPEIEARKIGKKEIAIVTFNSNRYDSYEQFKFFKKSAPYAPETWDKGNLYIGTVGFENRAWHMGYGFDKNADGEWEKNKEKERQLIERLKQFKPTEKEDKSKIGFFRNFTGNSFLNVHPIKPKAVALCWTIADPPNTFNKNPCTTAAMCPNLAGCNYDRPGLVADSIGFVRYYTSPVCKKDTGGLCGCCQPNIYDIDIGQICRTE